MPTSNKVIFALTNLSFQAVIGHFGVYSIIKHPMSDLFDYDQEFLGILDAIQLIGQILGSLSLLFIVLKPVKGFLIFALLNTVFAVLLCFPRYVENILLRDILVQISFFGQTVFTASLAFTQIIFSQYFDEDAKKCEHSVWYSLTFLGDIMSLTFAQILVYNYGLRWQFANIIWHVYIVGIGALMYFYLGDQISGQNQLDEILNQQNNEQNQGRVQDNNVNRQIQQSNNEMQSNQQSKCSLFLKLCNKIFKILKQPRILCVVLSFGLIQGLYTNLLFWVPYYYIIIDYQTYSALTILGISISIAVGGVLLEIVLFEILKLQHYSKPITYIMLVMSSITYFVVWIKRHDEPLVQVILLFVGNFLMACPFSRISAAEPIEQAEGNQHKLKTIFLLGHLSRNIVIATFVIIIGFFMKRDPMSFWSIILVNVGLALIVQTIRKICLRKKEKVQIIDNEQH